MNFFSFSRLHVIIVELRLAAQIVSDRSVRTKNCLDNDKIVAVVTRCHPIEEKELLIAVSLIFTQIFLRLREKVQLLFPIEGKQDEKKQRNPVACAGLEVTQRKKTNVEHGNKYLYSDSRLKNL